MEKETNEGKLALMYQSLRESINQTIGIPPETFKVQTASGVKVFSGMDEFIKSQSLKV